MLPLYPHHIHKFLYSVGGLLQQGLLFVGQSDLYDLLDALRAKFRGNANEQIFDTVLAVELDRARHNHFFVEQNRVHHLQHRGRGREVRATRSQELHDFGPAIAGTLYNLLDALRRE